MSRKVANGFGRLGSGGALSSLLAYAGTSRMYIRDTAFQDWLRPCALVAILMNCMPLHLLRSRRTGRAPPASPSPARPTCMPRACRLHAAAPSSPTADTDTARPTCMPTACRCIPFAGGGQGAPHLHAACMPTACVCGCGGHSGLLI